ncbi:hypothetical protein [Actinomadura nitritigenes]|uniref:hypothetical protein n=1 Tax=Actinomadura nitritigenes TaxID=134602 RepID=UPI003D8BE354
MDQEHVKAAGGPSIKTLSDLENGRRWDTLRDRTISRLEQVLKLDDGTLVAILESADYPDYVGDDPGLQRIWDITELTEEEREIAVRSLITYRDALGGHGRAEGEQRTSA